MGRRKKKNNTVNNIKIFFIGIILTALVACGVYFGLQYWTPGDEIVDIPDKKEVQVPPEPKNNYPSFISSDSREKVSEDCFF